MVRPRKQIEDRQKDDCFMTIIRDGKVIIQDGKEGSEHGN